ncbi:MAG: hypothetical protein DWH78_13660 [Planctomycetota bacterium]|nr:MAG: hypothetical protein DWH78_13660 [Planctomycetota bacterium]
MSSGSVSCQSELALISDILRTKNSIISSTPCAHRNDGKWATSKTDPSSSGVFAIFRPVHHQIRRA